MSTTRNSGKPWTAGEVGVLRQNAKTLIAPKIAKKLGRSEEAIQQKAHREGIKLKKKP